MYKVVNNVSYNAVTLHQHFHASAYQKYAPEEKSIKTSRYEMDAG